MMGRAKKGNAPSKLELLVKLMHYQSEYSEAFIQAGLFKIKGDLHSASRCFERFSNSAKKHIQTSLFHNQHHEDPVDVIGTVNTLLNGMSIHADVLQSLGQLSEAESVRQEMLTLSDQHLGEYGQAEVQRGQAGALISQGRFNEALVTLAAARNFFQRQGDDLKLARVTLDMVDILQWLGDIKRAQQELSQASKVISSRLAGSGPERADILGSIFGSVAEIMSGKGDGSKAQETVELFRIATELDYYEGLINKVLGNFDAAEHFFNRVLPKYVQMGAGPAIEYQLASIRIGQGRHDEALAEAERLEPIFQREGLFRPKLAAILRVKAEALINLGDLSTALNMLRQGIEDLDSYYDPDLLWRLQSLEGEALQAAGRDGDALTAFERAAQTVNHLRKAPLGYRLDSAYLRDKGELFEKAIDLACECQDGDRCAQFMEMIKSRILTATMSIPVNRSGKQKQRTELEQKVNEMSLQLDTLEYQGYKEGNAQDLKEDRATLLSERGKLLEQIRFSDPRWRAMSEPIPFDLKKISRVLSRRNQTALSLYYQPGIIIAVLIAKERVTTARLELTSYLEEKMEHYVRNLQASRPDPLLNDPSVGLAIGALHFLPEELLSKALNSDGLVVVPHGPLHLIPWAGLVYKAKRLFEYCPVSVVPNLSCVRNLDGEFNASPRVAIFGPPDYEGLPDLVPLLHAMEETESVQDIYQEASSLIGSALKGKEATSESFWKLLGHSEAKQGSFHIVCHGMFESFEPMNSGLLLGDSRVDAAEIARRKVEYEEVVLSACSTGWRPMKVQDVVLSGDDILGLPGAFLEAGAKSVLVSIPEADDEAAKEFMNKYHGSRVSGKTPMEALQETQKSMLDDGQYEPYTWLGFTVYGCR